MCGIILSTSVSGLEDPFLNVIKHRGIKSSGKKINNVTLCHHRLPIQTTDDDIWDQPIEISEGVYLMFNGEIFNYDKKIYDSDIEYLTALFSKYNSISNLEFFVSMYLPEIQTWDGFWAIVIYDSNNGNVIAFTDPLGKKLLYKNIEGDICSEIKGVISINDFDEIYKSSLEKWGYNTDNRTPYKDVKRLLPNNIYLYNIANPTFVKSYDNYYTLWNSPIDELVSASYEDHMNWLWDKMFESVSNRLVSKNYPISLLVSGGLDSSIIAAILKNINANVNLISIENGETPYINALEAHIGAQIKFLNYSMNIDKSMHIYKKWNETPIDLGSVLPQYYLFESIHKESDCRIVLSGDGADELFGGYNRIHEYDSQKSDIFEELSYYHLPRLDKMSMSHTLELRTPFLNLEIVRFAMHLPLEWRTDKKILKDTFAPMLPDSIVNRKKEPLKNPEIKEDKIKYRHKIINLFYK